MKQEREKYLGMDVVKCNACNAEMIFIFNPASKKKPGGAWVAIDKNSYTGEKNFVSGLHVPHMKTCGRFTKKNGVPPEYQIITVYARKDFSFTFPNAKGVNETWKFLRGDIFRSDASGKYFRSNIVNGNSSAMILPRERVVDSDGRIAEKAWEFLTDVKTSPNPSLQEGNSLQEGKAVQEGNSLFNHPVTQLVMREFEVEVV